MKKQEEQEELQDFPIDIKRDIIDIIIFGAAW